MNADSELQSMPQYEPFGPIPWMSISLSGLLSIALAIAFPVHTAYTLGLYNNYWEELYLFGALFSVAVSILGAVWTHHRVLFIDNKRVTALLFVYSAISALTFMILLHVKESQIAWIIPMWTSIHAIPLAFVSALRLRFFVLGMSSHST
jgi:hypothetical protein